MSHASPILPGERIAALDVIRGFALLGIFIMNMPGFNTSPFAGADGTLLFPDWWDRGTDQIKALLFDGKFNSLFSFLFAVGFTLQMERLRAADPAGANRIYLRRLLVLFGLGLLHGFVFWWGDVLHIYALLGILLMFGFSRLSDRWILALCVIFLCATPIYWAIRIPSLTEQHFATLIAGSQQWEASNNLAFGHGSFADAAAETRRMMVFWYTDPESLADMVSFYLQVCTTMLLGLLAGRHRWIQQAAQRLPLVRRLLGWTVGAGLLAGALAVYASETSDAEAITWLDVAGDFAYASSRVALMVAYLCAILLLMQKSQWQARFAPLAIAGRMPLTNYLLQTALGLAIFYGWGLGLWGRAGPLASLLAAVVFYFAVQVPLSRWWLARHRFGPMEGFWRFATYGRV